MKKAIFLLIFVGGIFFSGRVWAVEEKKTADDEVDDYKFETITTKDGMKFRIPKDMPIESRDGVTSPATTEEYIYVKFKQLDRKIQRIEDKLDRIEKIALAAAGDKYKEPSAGDKTKVLASH